MDVLIPYEMAITLVFWHQHWINDSYCNCQTICLLGAAFCLTVQFSIVTTVHSFPGKIFPNSAGQSAMFCKVYGELFWSVGHLSNLFITITTHQRHKLAKI